MFYCEETHEFIHPIFFESEEESSEVSVDQHTTTQEVKRHRMYCEALEHVLQQ